MSTVEAIKKALPQLRASLPPGVNVAIVSDRTQTIAASLADVRFTLLLTIALVVGVIALFLRKLWATVIPAISVPISLIGTFVVMYVLGYSLDNLSLMALTIAVGFVVDDAIVMVENIVRHIEGGAAPLKAARTFCRTGFPNNRYLFFGNEFRAVSNAPNITFANRPRILFVIPGTEFCSNTAVARPESAAESTIGPEA